MPEITAFALTAPGSRGRVTGNRRRPAHRGSACPSGRPRPAIGPAPAATETPSPGGYPPIVPAGPSAGGRARGSPRPRAPERSPRTRRPPRRGPGGPGDLGGVSGERRNCRPWPPRARFPPARTGTTTPLPRTAQSRPRRGDSMGDTPLPPARGFPLRPVRGRLSAGVCRWDTVALVSLDGGRSRCPGPAAGRGQGKSSNFPV